ncbi:MAG: hypothetical protein ACI4I9_07975 [Porcipelethomonas sp.]
MEKISFDNEQIRAYSLLLKSSVSDFKKEISRFKDIIEEIQNEWDSESGKMAVNRLSGLCSEAEEICYECELNSRYIDLALEEYKGCSECIKDIISFL